MRGYRYLKSLNQLGRITAVKEALTNTLLNQCERNVAKIIFGAGQQDAEVIVRQYLLVRLAGLNLNRALLYSLGKNGSEVIHPLPPVWREVLRQHGFKVGKVFSALIWNCYVGLLLVSGTITLAKQNLKNIKTVLIRSQKVFGTYAYFDGLVAGALPQLSKDGNSYDILSWYQQWPARVKQLETLCHSVKGVAFTKINNTHIVSVPNPILPLSEIKSVINYFGWCIVVATLVIFDLFRGRWWNVLLLKESSSAAVVRMQQSSKLARDYLFNNSNWIYRPLWTYEAKKHGSQITFYFYSTNCESFKRPDGYPKLTYGWQAMNWPHYLVWDYYQADFIYRAVGEDVNISIVGPIWFHTSAVEMPVFSKKAIAIFDITPFRSSHYITMGAGVEFYTPDVCKLFLMDVHQAAENITYRIFWKRKRKVGQIAHPQIRSFGDHYSKLPDVIPVDPDISAYRVIEGSEVVISMPFTSTALIAQQLGKPSCYYDPLGMIQHDDRAAHGIEICCGKEELQVWLSAVVGRLDHQSNDSCCENIHQIL